MASEKTVSADAFTARTSVEQVEESEDFAPKFDADGLIACITTDAESGEVLMLGYMNADALQRTIATGEAHYWSRSRQCLWHKGATSGLVKKLSRCASTTTKMPCGYASMSRVQVPVVTLGIALVFIAPYLLGKPEIPPRSSSLRKTSKVFDPVTSTGMRRIRHNCSIKLTVGLRHTRTATFRRNSQHLTAFQQLWLHLTTILI